MPALCNSVILCAPLCNKNQELTLSSTENRREPQRKSLKCNRFDVILIYPWQVHKA